MMRQAILKTIRSQNLYETIRSLELVHERLFDKNEIKNGSKDGVFAQGCRYHYKSMLGQVKYFEMVLLMHITSQ